ncbi:DUF5335 domain-containing protein, partial [Massilia jejuensis]
MTISKLEKAAWGPYFDHVSKTLVGKQAEIEVASLAIGAQLEAQWLPFLGIVYDHKNDLVEVLLEGLDHLIRQPAEIFIDEGPAGLVSLKIDRADGIQEIVRLRDPLMLPAPGAR